MKTLPVLELKIECYEPYPTTLYDICYFALDFSCYFIGLKHSGLSQQRKKKMRKNTSNLSLNVSFGTEMKSKLFIAQTKCFISIEKLLLFWIFVKSVQVSMVGWIDPSARADL